ncbi:MAG: DUF1080 domain-containing protein [Proteobacteria bacterium]|nr:MAG: DUF1080 domain-containing protein [Pseudomonadota bacterium]
MKRHLWVLLAGVALACSDSSAGLAGDPKSEDGYISLFNGKDLTGWRLGGTKLDGKTETKNKKWHVDNETIIIDGGGGGDIYTVKEFNQDFHLKLEFRAAKGADSGLFIRGPQLQVRDYPRAGPYNKVKFNDFDWNELDVTVRGGVVTTTVNGKTLTAKDVLELTVKDGQPQATLNGKTVDVNKISVEKGAVALCKCNGQVIEPAFKVGTKGGIGLQSETGKFEFRKIRIKMLSSKAG